MTDVPTNKFRQTFRETFISLRNRNYRLYSIGQLISNTGNWLTNVAITLLVLKITGSGLAVGIVTACQYGPVVFLSAWAGAIADRSDKRKLLLLTQTLEMFQSIGLAVLAFMPHTSLYGLYLIALVGGSVLAFDNPLRRSFVSEMVREEDATNAVVLYSTLVNITRIFGPALAGLLVVTVGFGWCFTIDAATYLVVILCIYMMRPAELRRQPPKPRTKGEVRAGIRYILDTPMLWINFAMLAVIGTLAYNFNVTFALFITKALHGSDTAFTVLYSIFSLGAVTSSLIIARRKLVRMHHMIFGAAGLGVGMFLFAIVPGVKTAAVAIFLMGMASMLYMNSTTSIIQIETKREMHGRLLALQMIFLVGTSVIGGPFSGWIADILGARAPIAFGAIVCVLAATFGYFANRTYNRTVEA